MNELQRYFEANAGGPEIDKWLHYFEIYERHLAPFRGRPVRVLEIGVFHGGSLRMWRNYFGPRSTIIGLDINPACASLAAEGIEVLIGDQKDRDFLRHLRATTAPFDILLDDGGHRPEQQIAAFEELYAHIDANGVYICEDLHANYWSDYGGGVGRPDTFVEYSKALVDRLNAWASMEPQRLAVDDFTRATHSLHFYPSVLVIEKRPMSPLRKRRVGVPTVPPYRPPG
jgi:predicted O-methyltransferase YrrM